ncbi:MAG TPA: hypothetical protein VFI91_12380, partial [Longimicrobiaceae bacterium]|nr:hypothetical protein [Longimicrobiaceae bacterium]
MPIRLTRSLRARILPFVALAVSSLFSACESEVKSPLEPAHHPSYSASEADRDIVTTNPREFAEALRRIDNNNEVLVLLKNSNVPPLSGTFLRDLPLGADVIVATPEVPTGSPSRQRAGLASANPGAREVVVRVLRNHGIQPYRSDSQALALRIPNEQLVATLAILLHHPNVDYLEANQRRPIIVSSDPVGTNSEDTKHTFHNVLDAWDYSRGAGVEVGILDSGYAFDSSTSEWHPDGTLINSSKGIEKLG